MVYTSIQSCKIFHKHLHTGMSKWNNFFGGKIIITWLCWCWGVLTLYVTKITIFSVLCALFLPDPSWTILNHLADHQNYTLSPKDLIFFWFLDFFHSCILQNLFNWNTNLFWSYNLTSPSTLLEKYTNSSTLVSRSNSWSPNSTVFSEWIPCFSLTFPFSFLQLKTFTPLKFPSIWEVYFVFHFIWWS